jgi:F-type H+-transporting ATPase subunit delta
MSQRTVSRRYASALYQEADASGVLDAIDEDVLLLRTSLNDTREFRRVFESPVIPREKKEAILQALLKERIEPLTLQFLHLLIEKDRASLAKPILDAYQALRDEHRGIVDAEATVARPLADDDREALLETLEERTGKTVRLHVKKEPALIGGLVVRIGDRVFDGSVRSQLNALHDRFRNAALSGQATEAAA